METDLNIPGLIDHIPYFGHIYRTNQVNGNRASYMKKLLEMELKRHPSKYIFNILEVGSWAGESAVLWANKIKELNANGRILCIDEWKPYDEILNTQPEMMKAFEDDRIFKLFLRNTVASGTSEIISYIRGNSLEILPLLRRNYFNMVYVDGSHVYEYVKSDILNAMRVTKVGGVISGDDLEIQADKEPDPLLCHIGVTQAVWDCFCKRVSSWQGFWAMRKESSLNYVEISLA